MTEFFMVYRKLLLISFVALFLFCGTAFSSEKKHAKIVSLAPSTTEILFALGLGDEIVGVSQFCDYPAQALSIEKVGSFSQPNVEKILMLRPDIIFCTGLEQAPIIIKLRQLRVNVCISDPKNFSELYRSIEEIGCLTGTENKARVLIESMQSQSAAISARVRPIPLSKRPKVFVEYWSQPLMTAGAGSFLDELIDQAGGVNVAHDIQKPYSRIAQEEVLRRNPDCIIMAYMNKENSLSMYQARFGWKEISAVKNKRVYSDIDPNIILRPGPRLTEGLRKIYERLYP